MEARTVHLGKRNRGKGNETYDETGSYELLLLLILSNGVFWSAGYLTHLRQASNRNPTVVLPVPIDITAGGVMRRYRRSKSGSKLGFARIRTAVRIQMRISVCTSAY